MTRTSLSSSSTVDAGQAVRAWPASRCSGEDPLVARLRAQDAGPLSPEERAGDRVAGTGGCALGCALLLLALLAGVVLGVAIGRWL